MGSFTAIDGRGEIDLQTGCVFHSIYREIFTDRYSLIAVI